MRPKLALAGSASQATLSASLQIHTRFVLFRTTAQPLLQSTSHHPAADRQNGDIGSCQLRRQADTASVPHSAFNQQQSAQSWCCDSVAPSHDLVCSRCRLLEGRKKESDRSPFCPSPQRDLLIAVRGAARLCQGASPQEGKQLRRVRLWHPCTLKVSASAPRLSYIAPLVRPSSST